MKRRALQLLLLAVFTSSTAWGQINCATGSAPTKLVCEFPVSTGVLSNSTALGNSSSQVSAEGNAQGVATALNVAIATQLSQLPLATASAGTIVIIKGGAPETFNNLGPILVDRAQTIGKKRVFLGFTASQYVFTNIDSQSLRSLPFSYYRTACLPGITNCTPSTAVSTTYTSEITSASFVVNQFVIVGTVGVTSKLDLSAIVPMSRVSVGAWVPGSTTMCTSLSCNYVVSANDSYFSAPGPISGNQGSASGVGDVEFGGKYALYVGEHATLSAGAIVRTPTGDALNFLGSGAWGFNPFLAYSYLSKVSPHAKIGFQWNTASELNNPTFANPIYSASGAIVTQSNASLPGGVQYDAGADWAASKRITVAADLLGNQYLNTYRLTPSNSCVLTGNGGQCTLSVPATALQSSSYSIGDLSTGLKWDPAGNLVFSANLLTQLNNNGMRARPTPLLGIAYKF